ncbi:MAG: hypothetical protein QOJ13_398 [Gaiellales bacterium]|nr:hypothetical protein [Gaiellales bacterium]
MGRWVREREREIVALAVVGAAAAVLVVGSASDDRRSQPTAAGTLSTRPSPPDPAAGTSVTGPGPPDVDYVIDLNTGEMTTLPAAIIESSGLQTALPSAPRYAVSPDGRLLAYVTNADDGSLQIFIAGMDGTRVTQMTHDPTGAESPAWSPDGTSIAYVGYGSGDVGNLFVLDVATGASRQISDKADDLTRASPQFTPDGSSLLYTGGNQSRPELRTVPVAGGKSTLLIGARGGLVDSGNGSLSPDGSHVTYLASGFPAGKSFHCGPCRFVANADGTDRRVIPGCIVNPAGAWSPDGDRIVCSEENGIIIVDLATRRAAHVARGREAIWLDRHTLLVEAA